MDRAVKIWRVHNQGELRREDKPLHSSTLVHRSSAVSIVWCVGTSDRSAVFPMVYPGYPKIRSSPIALRLPSRATSNYQKNNPPRKAKTSPPSRSGLDV